jgi:hypothetical protein
MLSDPTGDMDAGKWVRGGAEIIHCWIGQNKVAAQALRSSADFLKRFTKTEQAADISAGGRYIGT